jgi:hypothetical protein
VVKIKQKDLREFLRKEQDKMLMYVEEITFNQLKRMNRRPYF